MRRVLRYAAVATTGLSLTAVAAADPPLAPTPPAAQPAQPAAPWANKFFLPDIAANRDQPAPAVVTHNFGEVPHGTLCVHKFIITNIYDVPMQVADVRKGCTCLDYIPVTKVLEPNETAEFTVTMNSGKFVGANAQNFYVTLSSTSREKFFSSTAVLRLSATSRTDVSVSPGAISFGTVPQGTRLSQSVQVKYSGRTRDWKLVEAVPGSYPFEVKLSETSRGGPVRGGVEYQVDVTLNANASPGPISEQITLKTNDPANPLIHLGVTGAVVAPLEVNPGKVRFEVEVNKSDTKRVLVRASKPFKVVGVDGTGDGISVEPPAAGAALPVQVVVVKFEPKKAGAVARELRIRTDQPGEVSALLPVEATGTKAAASPPATGP